MADPSSRARSPRLLLAGIAVAAVVVVALAWMLRGGGSEVPEPVAAEERTPSAPVPELELPPPAPAQPAVRAPARRIGENGRLTVSRADLLEGDVLALGLDMPDVARGEGVREVKLVDADRARVLEIEGQAIDGVGTGLRIEIDPTWLEPGRYLIQVATADPTPLAVRRYVLEVAEPAAKADAP
jgi:hypothetical protein